jgi:hypothetical protein
MSVFLKKPYDRYEGAPALILEVTRDGELVVSEKSGKLRDRYLLTQKAETASGASGRGSYISSLFHEWKADPIQTIIKHFLPNRDLVARYALDCAECVVDYVDPGHFSLAMAWLQLSRKIIDSDRMRHSWHNVFSKEIEWHDLALNEIQLRGYYVRDERGTRITRTKTPTGYTVKDWSGLSRGKKLFNEEIFEISKQDTLYKSHPNKELIKQHARLRKAFPMPPSDDLTPNLFGRASVYCAARAVTAYHANMYEKYYEDQEDRNWRLDINEWGAKDWARSAAYFAAMVFTSDPQVVDQGDAEGRRGVHDREVVRQILRYVECMERVQIGVSWPSLNLEMNQ